jgi:hypothetical protein
MDEVDLPEHARDPRTGLRRLAPEIEAARDQIVDHFEDKPFSELKTFVQKLLEIEEDETKRLGALAARVYMLRKRIIDFEETVELVPAEEPTARRDMSDEPNTGNGWARVRVLENCEVNGMRLPEGIIVDVSTEDAQRLIDSGHAELREAAEPDLSEDDGEFDASESADLRDFEDDADDADAEDAPEPEDEADETDDEADEVAEADTPDEETLAAAEIADDAEADAPDAESAPDAEAVPDEQVLDTSDHALATAIAETAEAFNEIDVALAADIAEEQAASDDENETGDEADADAEADEEADET